MKLVDLRATWIIGLVAGGVIGVTGAPHWEMAAMFVGFFGAVTGALSAQCATSFPKGLVGAVLATAVGGGVMFLLASQENPSWVADQCGTLVVASGVVGCAIGLGVSWLAKR